MFKVVPPAGYKPRRGKFPDLNSVKINTPIRQNVFGSKGVYRCEALSSVVVVILLFWGQPAFFFDIFINKPSVCSVAVCHSMAFDD